MALKVLLTSARTLERRPGPSGLPFRVRQRAFGLHLVAQNVRAPVMLVERPTREQFARLLEHERFDLVGISLCACELGRARDLARLVRLVQPSAVLMLGGPGAAVQGIEQVLDGDHVERGDGILAVRRLLQEDEEAPVRMPAIGAGTLSTPVGLQEMALLVTGVAGEAGRRRLFEDGDALFAEAQRLRAETGAETFLVPDEGFLRDLRLSRGFSAAMEREGRAFELVAFARLDDLLRWPEEDLVRLGVFALVVCGERFSAAHVAKVRSLRECGIAVHATVVFREGAADAALTEALGLEADATELALDLAPRARAAELLEETESAAATTELAQVRLALAGRQVSRVVRLARTLLDGYRTYEFSDDPWLRRRAVQGRARLENLRLLLSGPSAAREAERALRESVERDFDRLLGPQSLPDRALAMTAQALREVQGAVRRAIETPAAPVCHYRWGGADNGRRRDRFSAD